MTPEWQWVGITTIHPLKRSCCYLNFGMSWIVNIYNIIYLTLWLPLTIGFFKNSQFRGKWWFQIKFSINCMTPSMCRYLLYTVARAPVTSRVLFYLWIPIPQLASLHMIQSKIALTVPTLLFLKWNQSWRMWLVKPSGLCLQMPVWNSRNLGGWLARLPNLSGLQSTRWRPTVGHGTHGLWDWMYIFFEFAKRCISTFTIYKRVSSQARMSKKLGCFQFPSCSTVWATLGAIGEG